MTTMNNFDFKPIIDDGNLPQYAQTYRQLKNSMRINTTRSSVVIRKASISASKGAKAVAISNFFESSKPSNEIYHHPLSQNAHALANHMNTKIIGLGGGF